MTSESYLAEFEQYIRWRLESNNHLIQCSLFTENHLSYKVRVFSDTEMPELVCNDFSPLTQFIADCQNTQFTPQVFTTMRGFNFGIITLWNNPNLNLSFCNENFQVSKLLFVEPNFLSDYNYEFIVAI